MTCRLLGIYPYHYLVDVLYRVAIHPAKDVIELTPRRWENTFIHQPMESDIHHHDPRHYDIPDVN